MQYGGGLGGNKPDKLFFANGEYGWAGQKEGTLLIRTTNGGNNWIQVSGSTGFSREIFFIDNMTGWKTYPIKKSTDGGETWMNLNTVTGGYIANSGIYDFAIISSDTIWGVGGYVIYPNQQVRTILQRSTNGGGNWQYQIPDTSYRVFPYNIQFFNNIIGWAYDTRPLGIHTISGGDPVFLNVRQISSEVPAEFLLHQNYPNPFNPTTIVRFEVKRSELVRLEVFDISGRKVSESLSSQLPAGTYEYIFNGEGLSSGVYFCSLVTRDERFTVKMVLAK